MGSEANIRHKTGKLPVQLYRTFFKVSIAAAVYAVFCIFTGKGDVTNASLAIALSILGAIGYELVYYAYKANSDSAKSSDEKSENKQLKAILHFFGYLLGLCLLILAGKLIYDGYYAALALMFIGFALCQQMHINNHISSHLSTFFESLVIASAVITLELMFYSLQLCTIHWLAWLFGVGATILSELLAQFFYHFYNCKKHGAKKAKKNLTKAREDARQSENLQENAAVKSSEELEKEYKAALEKESRAEYLKSLRKWSNIRSRLVEFCRDLLLICAIFSVFGILISIGSISLEMLDIAIAVIPVLYSIVSPILQAQKDDKKHAFDKYDPRISKKEFGELIDEMFGKASYSKKAFEYVTEKMTSKYGLERYNGEDYYVHPIAVAMILIENTNATDEVIASALLHDCIEDVYGCTKEFLEKEYNTYIAECVDVLSKKLASAYNYHESATMQKYLDDIALYPNAGIIKIADRINNMNTLENSEKAVKIRKFYQTRLYYPKFVAKMKALDADNKKFYEFAEKCFEEKKY